MPSTVRGASVLRVKAADDELREIEGWATRPEMDRVGDIVESSGIKFRSPLPLLLHHDHRQPVGLAWFSPATAEGIKFRAKLPKIEAPGKLQDRVNEAWDSVKHKLIAAVSIGFRVLPDGYEVLPSGGWRYTKAEVLELSLCTVPALESAVITGIKSVDTEIRSALRPENRDADAYQSQIASAIASGDWHRVALLHEKHYEREIERGLLQMREMLDWSAADLQKPVTRELFLSLVAGTQYYTDSLGEVQAAKRNALEARVKVLELQR